MASTTAVPETPVGGPDGGLPAGSLTELAALEAARDEKRQLLQRAAEAARTAKRALPTGCTPDDLPVLLQRYYWSEPAAEVLGHEPAELADLALGHLRLAEVRPPGSATVDAQKLPDGRAVIRLVTDDMPFLVDSVTAEVVRQGFALAHIVHPVVVVRRDLRGQILAFCDSNLAAGCGADALTESWMAVVLDGPLDDEASSDLVAGLRTVLDDVRAVDEDSERLRVRVRELADRLDELAPPRTKADTRSPVYRRAWLDLVAVSLPPDPDGRARQARFVGLFPSAAYTSSVVDVPLVRRRVAEVVTRSGVPSDSHTGKELLEVLETYPRDELLQVGADELLPVALAVLHLQERRQTRLFLRQDPTGRFWSALVYLPRDRYTTEVRLAMQQLLLEKLGGTNVEYTARSTESVLARLHFVVRLPVTKRGAQEQRPVDG